jgi:hypothetical protein
MKLQGMFLCTMLAAFAPALATEQPPELKFKPGTIELVDGTTGSRRKRDES